MTRLSERPRRGKGGNLGRKRDLIQSQMVALLLALTCHFIKAYDLSREMGQIGSDHSSAGLKPLQDRY